jgi:hypothetical protein
MRLASASKWLLTVVLLTSLPFMAHAKNVPLSNNNTYVNSSGHVVHSPARTPNNEVPDGATARCADGSYSFSEHRRETCSHHGGVAAWL